MSSHWKGLYNVKVCWEAKQFTHQRCSSPREHRTFPLVVPKGFGNIAMLVKENRIFLIHWLCFLLLIQSKCCVKGKCNFWGIKLTYAVFTMNAVSVNAGTLSLHFSNAITRIFRETSAMWIERVQFPAVLQLGLTRQTSSACEAPWKLTGKCVKTHLLATL